MKNKEVRDKLIYDSILEIETILDSIKDLIADENEADASLVLFNQLDRIRKGLKKAKKNVTSTEPLDRPMNR